MVLICSVFSKKTVALIRRDPWKTAFTEGLPSKNEMKMTKLFLNH